MAYVLAMGVFLTFMFAICLAVVISCGIEYRANGNKNWWFAFTNIIVLSIMGLLSLGFSIFIWVLFFYHILLIATNQTTNEYLKEFAGAHPKNPFARWGH